MKDSIKHTAQVVNSMAGWTALVLVAMMLWHQAGVRFGRVEGHFSPVTINAEITRIEQVGDNGVYTRIWGNFDKVRDCTFERLEWRLGDQQNSIPVTLTFEEQSKIRQTGDEDFGPWLVHLTEAQIDDSFGIAHHRCHVGWLTVTEFYP